MPILVTQLKLFWPLDRTENRAVKIIKIIRKSIQIAFLDLLKYFFFHHKMCGYNFFYTVFNV